MEQSQPTSSKQVLKCYSCGLKELRMECEIIDEDIILCNHCGSEAVEFLPFQGEPAKPTFVDREEQNKQMVDESIDYLLSFLPFGFGKKKPGLASKGQQVSKGQRVSPVKQQPRPTTTQSLSRHHSSNPLLM